MFSVSSHSASRTLAVYLPPASILLVKLELVSKKLNHFGGSSHFSEIGHQGHWVTGGEQTFDCAPPVSVPGAQSLKNNAILPKWFNSLDTNSRLSNWVGDSSLP